VTKKFTDLEFKGLTGPVSGKSGSSDIVDAVGFASFMAKAYGMPPKMVVGADLAGKPVLKPVPHFKALEHTSGLIKAHGDSGKKPDYGFAGGMKIIAIGPKGGKIIGYDIHHQPIYAGTPKATKLKSVADTVEKYAENTPDLHVLGQEWLTALGIHTPAVTTKAAVISAQDGEKLLKEYGIKTTPLALGQTAGVTWAEVIAHMGKPLVPHASKLTVAAHNLAAGVPDGKVFPEESFSTLKMTGDLGGTHAPKKAVDASGNTFVWKTNKGDVVASWGEETFNKVAALVSTDPSIYPKAQVGELAGKTGVLLEWKDSSGTLGSGSAGANVPEGALKKYAVQLARAHVLDWLMANHDAHGGNFLLSPDGKKLYPVDKGQAFKWVGHDNLSTEYHPNEHEPVYNKLWKLVEDGKLDTVTVEAIVEAVRAQIESVSHNLSIEQYQALVWPYIEEHDSKHSQDALSKWKAIKARFTSLTSDWEKFLSKVTGKSISLKVSAPPALSVVEAKPSLAAAVPMSLPFPGATNAPEVVVSAELYPSPELKVQQVPGWPQSKGTVTVHHPGAPVPPGVQWKAKFPGPGYKATVKYKGKPFTYAFHAKSGEMAIEVTFPDGSTHWASSPNEAADLPVLLEKGLPLTLTATEKKAAKIGYAANKLLKFDEFDFAGAASVAPLAELPDSAKSVQELEKEGKLLPGQQTIHESTPLVSAAPLPPPSTADLVTGDEGAQLLTGTGAFSSWKSSGIAEKFSDAAGSGGAKTLPFHPPAGLVAHAVLPGGKHLLWRGSSTGTWARVFDADGMAIGLFTIIAEESDVLMVAKKIVQESGGAVSAPDVFAALNSLEVAEATAPGGMTGKPVKALNLKLSSFPDLFQNHAGVDAHKLGVNLAVMTDEVNGVTEKWLPTDNNISIAPLPGAKYLVVVPSDNGFYAAVVGDDAGVLGEVEGTFAAPGGVDSGSSEEGQTLSSLPVPEKFEAIAKKLEGYLPASTGLSVADLQEAIEHIAEKNDPGGSKPPQTMAEVKASHAPLSGIEGTPVHALGSFSDVLDDPPAWKMLAESMIQGTKSQPIKHLVAAAPIAPGVILAAQVSKGSVEAGTVVAFIDEVGAPCFVFIGPDGKMKHSASLASKDISNFIAAHPGVDFAHLLGGPFMLPGIQATVKEIVAHAPVGVNAVAGYPHPVAPHISNVVDKNGVVAPNTGKKTVLAQVPFAKFAEDNLALFLKAEGIISGKVAVSVKTEPSKPGGDPSIAVNVKLANLALGKTKVDVAAGLSKFLAKYGIVPGVVGGTKMGGEGAYAYLSKSELNKTVGVETLVDDVVETPTPIPEGQHFNGAPFSVAVASLPVGEPFWMGIGGAAKKWKYVKDASGKITGEAGAFKEASFSQLFVWSHPGAWQPTPGATFADIPIGAEFILFQAQPSGASKKVFAKKVASDAVITDALPAGAPSIKIPTEMATFAPHAPITLADLDSAPLGTVIALDGVVADLGYKKGPVGWTGAGGAPVSPDVALGVLKSLHAEPAFSFCAQKLILPEVTAKKTLVEKFGKGAVVTKADLMAHLHELPVGKFKVFPKTVGLSGGPWEGYSIGASWTGDPAWTFKYEGKVDLPEGEYVCSGLSEGPNPESIPSKINKSMPKAQKLELLANGLPIGTTISLADGGGTFTLTHYVEGAYDAGPAALWKDESGQHVLAGTLLTSYPKLAAQVTPPNGAPGVQAKTESSAWAKAQKGADAPAITAAAAQAPKPLDPEAIQKAKEWGTFLTTHAVTDDELLLALAKVQAAGFPGSTSAFAYEGDSGTVLVGTNHEDLNGLTTAFLDALVGTKKTPAGTMLVLDKAKVKAKSALKMIDGPDGKSYPEGTTFDVAQVHKTKKDVLAGLPGFKKTVPHQSEPSKKTVAKFEHATPQAPSAQAEVKAKVEAAGIPVQEVAGNLSIVVTVANADLEEIESTTTVVTPLVPPLPMWKQSSPANAPVLGPQLVGAPHVANKADLGAMTVIKPGVAGHFIRCGDPAVLADCRLQVKKVHVGGKVTYEVFGTLTETTLSSIKHGKPGNLSFGVTSYDENHHDPETGFTKAKGTSDSKSSRNATTPNGSSAAIVMKEDVYQRVFRITVPEGVPLEAEIAAGLTALGLPTDKVLADHAADPSLERKWMKQRILRQALGGAGVVTTQYASEAVRTATQDEAKLDAMLVEKVGPGWKKVFDTAQVVVGAAGDATVAFKSIGVGEGVKGLVTKGVLESVKFVSSGVPTMDLVMFHLANGFQTSRKFGNLMGTGAPGASASQDETSGGAIGAFASIATDNTKNFTSCQSHSSQRIVYAPQVLESCLGHFSDGDTYGKPVYGKPNRVAGDATSSSNEWICHDYIPMEYAVGVACETLMVKEAALKKWKKQFPERKQVNGIPVEDFFFVAGAGNDSNHVGHVMDKCKGLKMKKAGG
jgi:hypothetical protein